MIVNEIYIISGSSNAYTTCKDTVCYHGYTPQSI